MKDIRHGQKLQKPIDELDHLVAAAGFEVEIFVLGPFTLTGINPSDFPGRFAAAACFAAVASQVRGHGWLCLGYDWSPVETYPTRTGTPCQPFISRPRLDIASPVG